MFATHPIVRIKMLRRKLLKHSPYSSEWYWLNEQLAAVVREWRLTNTLVGV